MGRPRKHAWLKECPGLYVRGNGYFYARREGVTYEFRTTDAAQAKKTHHYLVTYPGLYRKGEVFWLVNPNNGKSTSLNTTDEAQALAVYRIVAAEIGGELAASRAATVIAGTTATPADTAPTGDTLGDYAREFVGRLDVLTSKRGRALSPKTTKNYRTALERAVDHPAFAHPIRYYTAPATAEDALCELRGWLSEHWAGSSSMYNQAVSALSRLFEDAIFAGKAARNPTDAISRRHVAERTVYLPHAEYAAILDAITRLYGPETGEYWANVCHLIYLLGARPGDALTILDQSTGDGVARYQPSKRGHALEITYDDGSDTQAIIDYLKRQRLRIAAGAFAHPYLVCHPAGDAGRRMAGRAVREDYLGKVFREAVKACGYLDGAGKPMYRLYDLRAKSETDERNTYGDSSNKAGWRSPAMAQRYDKAERRHRAQSRLSIPGAKK